MSGPVPLRRQNPQHFVCASLQFVIYLFDSRCKAKPLHFLARGVQVAGADTIQSHQWENARFGGHPAHFPKGLKMKIARKKIGIEKKKMGAERQIELAGSKSGSREGSDLVAALAFA